MLQSEKHLSFIKQFDVSNWDFIIQTSMNQPDIRNILPGSEPTWYPQY